MTLYERVQAAAQTLTEAGLYARGSSPIEWEKARLDQRPVILVSGGASKETDDPHGLNLTQTPFHIEGADAGFLVRMTGVEKPFANFDDALAFVLRSYGKA